ncbi:MAG TPA: DNA ligase D [Rhizomicrobium sp.]|jgi:bifunctional non-homologous end joining protein LigD
MTRMPSFIEPELCRVVDTPPGEGWAHEVKFDGYRIQIRVERGKAALRTRKGLDWTERFPEISKEASKLPDCLIDTEIVAMDDHGVSDFAGLQAALSDHKTDGLVCFVFDALFVQGEDLRDEPLTTRKARLETLLKKLPGTRLRFVHHFESSGSAMLNAACGMHLEGVVSKRLDSPYRSGRSGSWTKAKCRGGQEVVIGGWWGDATHLRSLLVGAHRGGKFVYMGRVGTGYNARNIGGLLKALVPLKQSAMPFAPNSEIPRRREINWVKPVLVAEVEFTTITAGGLLRQAAFKGLREDKPAGTIVPEPQPAAKRETKPMPKAKLTHPDKVLWPKAGKDAAVTKADLAAYYDIVSARLLEHIADRPLSLVRTPDGIGGQHFFQRHLMPGSSSALKPVKVKGEPKPYLTLDSAEGLQALAQSGSTEIHPWGCKKGDPETPARIVFDLDPAEDLKFPAVIAAAREMRTRLKKLGFEPFVKTTGGKGLHVVIAVKGTPKKPITWPDAKSFAHDVCLALEKDAPDRYTTNMSKKLRKGKIFLDYLRNDRTSTAVAPWSPRARAHATISMPLPWSALKSGLDPLDFTMHKAKALIKRADPWKGIDGTAKALPK